MPLGREVVMLSKIASLLSSRPCPANWKSLLEELGRKYETSIILVGTGASILIVTYFYMTYWVWSTQQTGFLRTIFPPQFENDCQGDAPLCAAPPDALWAGIVLSFLFLLALSLFSVSDQNRSLLPTAWNLLSAVRRSSAHRG